MNVLGRQALVQNKCRTCFSKSMPHNDTAFSYDTVSDYMFVFVCFFFRRSTEEIFSLFITFAFSADAIKDTIASKTLTFHKSLGVLSQAAFFSFTSIDFSVT